MLPCTHVHAEANSRKIHLCAIYSEYSKFDFKMGETFLKRIADHLFNTDRKLQICKIRSVLLTPSIEEAVQTRNLLDTKS